MIYLVRDGEPDWPAMNARHLPGAANDLVDLTVVGILRAERAVSELGTAGAADVVSSPMTRALKTAGVIAAHLGLPVSVDFDLREWCPDKTYRWTAAALSHRVVTHSLTVEVDTPYTGVRPIRLSGAEVTTTPRGGAYVTGSLGSPGAAVRRAADARAREVLRDGYRGSSDCCTNAAAASAE